MHTFHFFLWEVTQMGRERAWEMCMRGGGRCLGQKEEKEVVGGSGRGEQIETGKQQHRKGCGETSSSREELVKRLCHPEFTLSVAVLPLPSSNSPQKVPSSKPHCPGPSLLPEEPQRVNYSSKQEHEPWTRPSCLL